MRDIYLQAYDPITALEDEERADLPEKVAAALGLFLAHTIGEQGILEDADDLENEANDIDTPLGITWREFLNAAAVVLRTFAPNDAYVKTVAGKIEELVK